MNFAREGKNDTIGTGGEGLSKGRTKKGREQQHALVLTPKKERKKERNHMLLGVVFFLLLLHGLRPVPVGRLSLALFIRVCWSRIVTNSGSGSSHSSVRYVGVDWMDGNLLSH